MTAALLLTVFASIWVAEYWRIEVSRQQVGLAKGQAATRGVVG